MFIEESDKNCGYSMCGSPGCNHCNPPLFAGSALDRQVGGQHYDLAIQPIEYIHANKLGFIEGNIIKYISRWRNKNGIEDLKKVEHYLQLLMELESNE